MVGDIAFIDSARWSPRLSRKHANRWRFIVCRWRHPGARACRLGRCTVRETHTNPNQEQWNEWISSDPEIAPHCVVPGRAHRTVRALAERWRIEHVDFRSVPVVSHGCEEAVGACRAALAPLVAQDDGVTA